MAYHPNRGFNPWLPRKVRYRCAGGNSNPTNRVTCRNPRPARHQTPTGYHRQQCQDEIHAPGRTLPAVTPDPRSP